tara:strand:- start:154 stop:480 length:327 start_codon:yes stop_codon:yes gene_type:complete
MNVLSGSLNSRLVELNIQKLLIIKFKPKPEFFDEFVSNITEFNKAKHRVFHLMKSGDELHAIVIRDASILEQDASDGVKWLDGQRQLLQEFNADNKHTIPLSGDVLYS